MKSKIEAGNRQVKHVNEEAACVPACNLSYDSLIESIILPRKIKVACMLRLLRNCVQQPKYIQPKHVLHRWK